MFPIPFEYAAAASVREAIALLQQYGDDAKILAGGHSLLPLMKLRLAAPALVVDIGRVDALAGVRQEAETIHIGALTTYSTLLDSEDVARTCPLLAETAGQVGDVQVRNRGTLGGAIAHADPAGDIPAAVLALDATLRIEGPAGARMVPSRDFFLGPFTTALAADELLVGTSMAAPPPRTGAAYEKFRNPASGYAVVGVAALVTLAENEDIVDVRVAVTGAAGQPSRAVRLEEELRGRPAGFDGLQEACNRIAIDLDVIGDSYASPGYRSRLVGIYAARALRRAIGRAER